MQLKLGGKFHLRLNIGERPIANKYREGKMKSTLERELTVREIVERETLEVSLVLYCSTSRCIQF
jgi:hypothetical protein